MPIVDVEWVSDAAAPEGLASALADVLAGCFGCGPGRVWVRLRLLPSACYGENGGPVAEDGLPVFVTVLHAHPPQGEALRVELMAVTEGVAGLIGCAVERVHVQVAPAAAGRQAFGGRVVG